MTTRRLRRWTLSGLCLAGTVAGAWFLLHEPAPAGAEYRTAVAAVGRVESTVTALGKLAPKNSVDVGAQVSGQLQVLHVGIGDRVAQGDLLAEIDARVMKAKVDADKASLKELQASLAQQRAELKLAEAQAARNRRLLQADAIARQDVEVTDVALLVAKAKIAQLEAQIEKTQSTLDGNLANLGYTKIYAPMAGTVIDVVAFEGQTLNANQSAPTILTIADLSVMTVEADVSEADVSRLRPGLEAYFTTLGQPERRWTSTVRQVLPQPEVLNDVVLYKALLDVDNPAGELLPEMSAQVFFVLGRAENVVTVPLAALRQKIEPAAPAGGLTAPAVAAVPADSDYAAMEARLADRHGVSRGVVLVSDGQGRPQPRPVLVGLKTRVSVEIVTGLGAGEVVVVGGGKPAAAAERGRPSGLMGVLGGRR